MGKSYQELEDENKALKNKIEQLEASYQNALINLQDRLSTEERLKESDERFKTVFEQSNVPHKIIDIDLKMVNINNALCDMLGYSKEEILGTTILDYTHPDFIAYWYDLHDALWKKELPFFSLEACLINKDKKEIWCRVNTIRFQDQGEVHGFTILEDITDRKQLDRHKDDFISTVSHELKTPLTSLKMRCQVLISKMKKIENDFAIDMAQGMDKQIDRLTRLINDLVNVSKIENGKLQQSVVPYDLNLLIEGVADEFTSFITDRTIRFKTPHKLVLHGDPDRIQQVIYNLISNAVKFSSKDTIIDISLEQKETDAVVCIQDYGRGIPKKSLDNIFKRFYKAEYTANQLESGLGLGLFICMEIIRSQNGRLWVESTPGKGSTFCFTLPMLPEVNIVDQCL